MLPRRFRSSALGAPAVRVGLPPSYSQALRGVAALFSDLTVRSTGVVAEFACTGSRAPRKRGADALRAGLRPVLARPCAPHHHDHGGQGQMSLLSSTNS
jgi:hypothetical protein